MMRYAKGIGFSLALLCRAMLSAEAEVKPHNLFTPGAVLQQGMSVPVWGTGRDGEKVTVRVQGQSATTVTENGKWMVYLKNLKAGGPFTLEIQGDNRVEVKDVLVGEVWICSGQSNMQWPVAASADPDKVIATAGDANLRLFTVPRRQAFAPESSVNSAWKFCTAQEVRDFSAVAYAFGRALRRARHVPIGLISANYGGTAAEWWTRREVLEQHTDLRGLLAQDEQRKANYLKALANYPKARADHRAAVEAARREGKQPPPPPSQPFEPIYCSGLYNAMIAPLIPYAIRGAIWYQGESNAGRAYEYRTLFPTMIQNWREDWKQGEFPFLFVQLAPFGRITTEPVDSAWAELREAQTLTLTASPKTGMAVITDLGDSADIHPRRKETVGERLALAARAIAYREKLVYSGPMYRSLRVEGDRIVVKFRHVGSGLTTQDGAELKGFTIAGKEGKFYNAKAEIRGSSEVVVSCPSVTAPVAVRYAWSDCPVVNLANKEGLPASPFRTDNFKMVTKR
jgi:sialate O-acetylesterase